MPELPPPLPDEWDDITALDPVSPVDRDELVKLFERIGVLERQVLKLRRRANRLAVRLFGEP